MIGLVEYGRLLNQEKHSAFMGGESLRDIITIESKKKRTKGIKKKGDLEYLQIKVFLLFLGDLISHLTENYFYYPQGNGKKQMIRPLSIVHSYIVRIS